MLLKNFQNSISNFNGADQQRILSAYDLAKERHAGQKRRSGGPYIHHPLRVATNLANDGYGKDMIIAGLLHDTIEDTKTTKAEISKIFGNLVAQIVDGVTVVSKIKIKDKARVFSDDELYLNQVDNYRKLLFASTTAPEILIVKLYDRLDNAATLDYITEFKRKFYARETIDIFASIAERMGMGVVKGQLEDYSFRYAYPEEYKNFKKVIRGAYKNPQKIIGQVKPEIESELNKSNIDIINIAARAKHHYSLYKKLKRKHDLSLIFDIIALRIIVKDLIQCYETLGILHTMYEPIPGKIKDYIANPKQNGYQSLHTTLKDKDGNIFEIQIRTPEMHHYAEYGAASHWNYKEINHSNRQAEKNAREWINELKKVNEVSDQEEFLGLLKNELFSDQIFVFTPKNDIVKLPAESTGLDFAYRIHSGLGDKCAGIKVNGRIVPLSTKLKTNDIIEIITSPKATPNRDWLNFVHTSGARQHIRNYLRRKEHDHLLAIGIKKFNELLAKYFQPLIKKDALAKLKLTNDLPYRKVEDALIGVAEGSLTKIKLLKSLYPEIDTSEKRKINQIDADDESVGTLKNIRHELAKCCKPTAADNIIGYVSRDHIIRIHKKSCNRLKTTDPNRIIDLTWYFCGGWDTLVTNLVWLAVPIS